MTPRKLAIAAIGRDRVGLVRGVSRVLFRHGCNIEDSSMTILEGEFAMILIVSLPAAGRVERLKNALGSAGRKLGLTLNVNPIRPAADRKKRAGPARPYLISVMGRDRTGIVYRMSDLLARMRVNITDLNAKRVGRGSATLYCMVIEVELPAREHPDRLRRKLQAAAKTLGLDLTLKPVEALQL